VEAERASDEPQEPLCPVGAPDVGESELDSDGQVEGPEGFVANERVLGVVGREVVRRELEGGRRRVELDVDPPAGCGPGETENGVNIWVAVDHALLDPGGATLAAYVVVLKVEEDRPE